MPGRSFEVHVIEAKLSSSGSTGSTRWRWDLFNQDEIKVLETEAVNLFELKARDA